MVDSSKSDFWRGAGVGMALFGLFVGAGVSSYYDKKGNAEEIRAEKKISYQIQQRDLNENGLPETFIEIDNVRYYSAIDGRNLTDSLDRK